MHIVTAHDWLTNWHGAEKVLAELVAASGASGVVSSVIDPQLVLRKLPDIEARALWTNHLPGAGSRWSRYALPMYAAWSGTKIEADALVVSSHFAAHAATIRFDGPSIAYYHTPARILWRTDLELERLHPRWHSLAETVFPALRAYDRWVAQHPTVVLANSGSIAKRIDHAYGRSAKVIHPPVDTQRWSGLDRNEPRHLLWLGRLVSYKRPSLAIEAARSTGLPIIIVGDGPERPRLEALGYEGATFLGRADEAALERAMAEAIALIHPGEEDFGISLVEAQAAGVPVIAYAAGGALETVVHGVTGLHVDELSTEAFADAIRQAAAGRWDTPTLKRHAEQFNVGVFRRRISEVVQGAL